MGNSSSKDSKGGNQRSSGEQGAADPSHQHSRERLEAIQQAALRSSGRGARYELPFLTLGRDRVQDEQSTPDRPRETKQEREARKAERSRQARLAERERSMREEHVDGGFLVTVGVYTGPEDFNKAIVRQLQIERRLAPFWRGLNDHSDSWTEAQLVAAVRGLPIPAPDEVPAMDRTASQQSSQQPEHDAGHLNIPITPRTPSYQDDSRLSSSHPVSAPHSGPASPTFPTAGASGAALFRGRAKTLASLATGSRNQSSDMIPQEIRLPHDPNVNGLPVEAYLYREPAECPICFMYYPLWLNRTRCCDQPICSECFVQIKRPDPHPPEHEQPGQERPPEEQAEQLVSEVASCPFCVTPEFGVTYDPPPFRRGLAYPSQGPTALKPHSSAMSSSSSLTTPAGRRRATSLSATAPQVITTDKVRPDWAKKLADARAHVLRRSAAATALHNAAYVLGNQGDAQTRAALAFGRRRRTLFVDSPGGSGSGTPTAGDDAGRDLYPGRGSSRRNRVDDLEELMMMEAIRLSLAAEEERKKKEEKEQRKKDKKEAKDIKKEVKAAEKVSKKNTSAVAPLYPARSNESSSTWASTSMARSTSNLGMSAPQNDGKGKAPAQDFAGFNPLTEPTSTINTEMQDERSSESPSPTASATGPVDGPQKHLEASRANIQAGNLRIPHSRQLSSTSSIASSFGDPVAGGSAMDLTASGSESPANQSGTPSGTPGLEPMLNFQSLAAMIGQEGRDGQGGSLLSPSESARVAEEDIREPSPTQSPTRSRGNSGGDSANANSTINNDVDAITPVISSHSTELNDKQIGEINVLGETTSRHTTAQ